MEIANPVSVAILYGVLAVIVLFALAVLARNFAARGNAHAAPAAPVLHSHHVAPLPTAASSDSVLVAVLAAAAYEALGENVRIVSIRPVPDAWSIAGRQALCNSHHPLF